MVKRRNKVINSRVKEKLVISHKEVLSELSRHKRILQKVFRLVGREIVITFNFQYRDASLEVVLIYLLGRAYLWTMGLSSAYAATYEELLNIPYFRFHHGEQL